VPRLAVLGFYSTIIIFFKVVTSNLVMVSDKAAQNLSLPDVASLIFR